MRHEVNAHRGAGALAEAEALLADLEADGRFARYTEEDCELADDMRDMGWSEPEIERHFG